MKKLLLFGPNSIHVSNYLDLIEGYFDEVLVISDGLNPKITKYEQKLISFSIRNPFQNKKNINQVKRIVAEFKPDLVHLHNIGTGAYLLEKALRNVHVPKVATAWGSDVLVAPKRSFVFRKILKNVFSSFDIYTADAQFMADEMKAISKQKLDIRIANFGVDPVTVDLRKKENIIYSNRLHNDLYRIDLIIDLFQKFIENSKDKSWKLIVAATGSNTEILKEKVKNLQIEDLVDFVGWIDHTQNQNWYQKAKIYISIPLSDGTSISLLEALQNACIPIVSDLPANREWVNHDLNGIIFNKQYGSVFADALALDFGKAIEINKEIIKERGLKSSNKAIFLSIYDEMLKLN